MKKILLLFISLLFAHAQSQMINKLDIKDYVVDANFLENKYDQKYLLIGDFLPVQYGSNMRLAKIFTNTGWGYINENGEEIIKPIYQELSYFYNGVVTASEKVLPKFDSWSLEEYPVIINYKGKILTSKKDYAYLINYVSNYQKGMFTTSKNKQNGVMNINGKVLVPFKYQLITYLSKFIIADVANLNENREKILDVYRKDGKFVKSIIGNRIMEVGNYLVVEQNLKSYFIDKKTLKRIDDRNFLNISNTDNSKLFKYKVQILDQQNDKVDSYFLDDDLKIVNGDFPNSILYEDRFFGQPFGEESYNPTKYIISDLKNNKIAAYSVKDFYIYQTFAHGKLDDPEFLQSKRDYYKKLAAQIENKSDYHIDLEHRKRFVHFFEVDETSKKKKAEGYIDANTGKIVIKREMKDILYISHLQGTEFFFIKYDNLVENKIFIFNNKNKILNATTGDYLSGDYNYRNNPVSDFYILTKKGKIVDGYNRRYKELLRKENMKPVFQNQEMFFMEFGKELLVFGYYKDGKGGLLDKNYKIVRPAKYIDWSSNYSGPGIYILHETANRVELINADNLQTILNIEFKDGVLKKRGEVDSDGQTFHPRFYTGYYDKGFYTINEDKLVMDRYGNIIYNRPELEQTYK